MGAVRVLLVDDSQTFRRAAAGLIERTPGFELVATAGSGEEAVQLAKTSPPDLILMDVQMKGIGGCEAARRILAADKAVRIVLITAEERLAAGGAAVPVLNKRNLCPDTLTALWRRDVYGGEPQAPR